MNDLLSDNEHPLDILAALDAAAMPPTKGSRMQDHTDSLAEAISNAVAEAEAASTEETPEQREETARVLEAITKGVIRG